MRNYYGANGAGANRFSERFTQLRVRQRLVHSVRIIMARYGKEWHALPRAQADLGLLMQA